MPPPMLRRTPLPDLLLVHGTLGFRAGGFVFSLRDSTQSIRVQTVDTPDTCVVIPFPVTRRWIVERSQEWDSMTPAEQGEFIEELMALWG